MLDQYESDLIEDVVLCSNSPLRYVLYAFPWGEVGTELAEFSGPEDWQRDLLLDIENGLKSVADVINEATASGHGIGKSAVVAWIILWAMSTFEDTRGVVTANTESQLRTKTWPELVKWHNLAINRHWFKVTATAIFSVDPEHEKTWRIDAIPWSETRTEAFAGLHNKGKRILVIFDEASAIPDVIWEVTEGALTDENTQIIWCVFGNPTRNTGRFHACFNKLRHRWNNHRVDSRTVSITNKKQIDKWIEDYGLDSDFVKVRVRGDFPSAGDRQFIPSDIVQEARGKHLRIDQYNFAAKIIGVDPAWTGEDEMTIYFRQGLMSRKLMTLPKNDDDYEVAGYIAKFEDDLKADAVFIDFGYGTGIYSAGKQMKRNWRLVKFGSKARSDRYLNKRIEMWADMKEWLKNGGAIEDDPVLCDELIGPEYYVVATGGNAGKEFLESKDDMKKRGLSSPNRADALALTFAEPVKNRSQRQFEELTKSSQEYNPFKFNQQTQQKEYNPFSPLAR